jgi:hypothetical protein
MFAKIFTQIFDSSIADDWQVRVVFQDMLVLADKNGIIDMTPEAIARRTNIPLDIIQAAIPKLEREDNASRTPDHGGRRIMRLDAHRDWGWRIVNFVKYRESATKEMLRMAEADRKRAWRERNHRGPSPRPPTHNQTQKQTAEADKSMDMSRTNSNARLAGLDLPQISHSERISFEKSLDRINAELDDLNGPGLLPKFRQRRDLLRGEKSRILRLLGLKV